GATSLPVDRAGTRYDVGVALSPRIRVGLRADSGTLLKKFALHLEYEHDLLTGDWASIAPPRGSELPDTMPTEQELRMLYLRFSVGQYFHAGGGFMTSNVGLGLVANDGAQSGW